MTSAAGARTRQAITVRRATRADLVDVVALRLALLKEHHRNPLYGRLRPDAKERAEKLFATQLASDQEATFLAVRGERAIGIIRCVHAQGSPLLLPAEYAYVSSAYVVPEARRAGAMRALLGAVEEWCRGRGLEELRLHNASDNPVADATWDALGFEVVEHLRLRRV